MQSSARSTSAQFARHSAEQTPIHPFSETGMAALRYPISVNQKKAFCALRFQYAKKPKKAIFFLWDCMRVYCAHDFVITFVSNIVTLQSCARNLNSNPFRSVSARNWTTCPESTPTPCSTFRAT